MPIDGRWTLAALTSALLVLYFTPWLALGDGVDTSGYALSSGLTVLLAPIDRFDIGQYLGPVLGWTLPLIGFVGLVQSARGRISLCAMTLAVCVCSLLGFGFWQSPWYQAPTLASLPLTHAGMAVLASALLSLVASLLVALLSGWRDHRHGITEHRRADGTVAIEIRPPRWRPLRRLLYFVANVAIIYVALLFWAHHHLLELADQAMVPVTLVVLAFIALAVAVIVRSALRHNRRARIVIDQQSLSVITGGDCGRYQRQHINGLYVPQQADDNVRDYYDAAHGADALTLPVTTQIPDTVTAEPLLGKPCTRVMMRLRHRTVALAHHLGPAQARELVRRLTIRLLD
ncbi:hypothetical protein T5B8_11037 [Salinisphaera sp. T5B8]|uniref:hypothetical protein n=1 Tax=Salinisphaera sp. T5B8 TaxID=1304154 RepID=UPI00333F9CCD